MSNLSQQLSTSTTMKKITIKSTKVVYKNLYCLITVAHQFFWENSNQL